MGTWPRDPQCYQVPITQKQGLVISEVAFKAQLRRQLGDNALWGWNTAL